MTPIGSSLPIRSFPSVPQELAAQVTQAVQADPSLADPTLRLLQGMSSFDPATSSTAAATSGGVTSPQDAFTTSQPQQTERYGERVALGEETETIRSTVNQNTAAKKGAAPQTRTPDQTVKIPPAQVENRLRTDPNFRAQLEQRLGGTIILDDAADGNITVERTRPATTNPAQTGELTQQQQQQVQAAAALGFAAGASLLPAIAAAGVASRLERIGQRLGSVLNELGGPSAQAGQQLQATDGASAQWPQQLGNSLEVSLKATFNGNTIPNGGFGGLSGWDDGYLSRFGNQADSASRQFVDATVRFGTVLGNTAEVFNSAQLGMQRAQLSGN